MQRITNGTLLGVLPLGRTLPVAGVALVVLFVVLRPEASRGLDSVGRVLFWSLHISLGLCGVWCASLAIGRRWAQRIPAVLAVLLTGMLGAALVAPAYWGLEQVFAVPSQAVPDDWLDRFAERGLWQGLAAEYLEVVPLFVVTWLVMNLPLLVGKPQLDDPPPPKGPDGNSAVAAPDQRQRDRDETLARFYASLPDVLGRDIVAVSSDLHYLHVYTALGKAIVLGNLGNLAEALADTGMLVHRSHWVAHAHLRQVQMAGNEGCCVMSNGLRIPISRRRRKQVKERYGQGVVGLHEVGQSRKLG
ncbi:LytTR family transcriptional regulator [Exilibacterium tricleocarpae]|uniref:LytTR family transcriptional regulator n=1 Tax=Exilibacterium tricleocarpae TaxID=2591008 RepID=A0A545TZ50_9GAMM|nr:LytTR family DNA-binding domain-containing protein [Exilibacterium tricleocarpae]TQV82496.1 LytTR family transcriptional regulator [Exilibacterium tricleocarpae]